MAEERAGWAGDLSMLAPDMRALIDFLEPDSRPTAIFHYPENANTSANDLVEHHCVYVNPALRQLTGVEDELAGLQHMLKDLWSAIKPELSHTCIFANRQWQWRVVGEYRIAVGAVQYQEKSVQSDITKENACTGGDVESMTQKSWAVDGATAIDWTQAAVAGMTPWIEFIRSWDWAATGLGPIDSWSPILRATMRSIMSNPNPRLIVWGASSSFVYNEACAPLWGRKHPDCLGSHVSHAWAEVWEYIEPMLEEVKCGEVKSAKGFPLLIDRNGFLEETYWDFSLLPILDVDGKVVGACDELTESTVAVTGVRRRNLIRDLSKKIDAATTLPRLWSAVLDTLEAAHHDVAFAALYSVVEVQGTPDKHTTISQAKECQLVGTVGLSEGHLGALQKFSLDSVITSQAGDLAHGCFQAWQNRHSITMRAEDGSLPPSLAIAVEGRAFGAPVETALISPIRLTISPEVPGILLMGLNSRCAFSGEYELFINVVTDFVEKAAALISLPEEQRRVQKISDDIQNSLTQQLRLTTLKAERSEAKFTRLAATAPTGMFMFDPEGVPLYVNDTYLVMLGMTREEALSKRPEPRLWEDIVHQDDLEHFVQSWQRITERKVPSTVEFRLKKPWESIDKFTGQEISGKSWLLATAFPEIDANGSVTTVQGWLTDISHKKFTENLLSQRLEDALENKRQTENFIDMTSHEMRNPLSAILQSADSIVATLASASMSAESQNMVLHLETAGEIIDAAETIILCAQHQKRIVDDILTLSKLDASLLVISPDKVQPPTLITKALKMYEAEIERAEIETQLIIEPTYKSLDVDWVLLDPSRLLQVIINLLTNSLKFTQYSQTRKITICLGASYQPPTGKHHGISFAHPRRFRPQQTSPSSDGSDGEDIYLQIAVYDTGRGLTEEELAMLFQRFQQASPKTYSQYGGSGLGLFISRELCELQGGQIGAASGGGKTVFTFYVKAKRWIPKREVVKMDVMATATPLKRFPSFTSTAASPMAYGRRGASVMDGGSDQLSHDTQPMPSTDTGMNLSQTLQKSAAEISIKDEIHVLIVEDNLINQKVMSQQLRRAGCTVHVANHGVECLDFLEKSTFCHSETPLSVILLDLEMPTMDGLTCIRYIRERQSAGIIVGHVPVIAVTANARSEQIARAIEAGMDQVVTKPFRIPELIPQMESLITEMAQLKRPRMHIENGT